MKEKTKNTTKSTGLADPRFEHVSHDPKFHTLHKRERKVVVDDRFSAMFSDQKFGLKSALDKRGRPSIGGKKVNHLRRLYQLPDDDKSGSESDVKQPDEQASDDDALPIKIDLARGEGNLPTSSSEESSSEYEFDYEEEDKKTAHPWGEMSDNAPKTTEITSTLAVCNMDWDRVRALDLLMLFQSFKPDGGRVLTVTIYPSDFGTSRMQQEDVSGPQLGMDEENEVNEEEDKISSFVPSSMTFDEKSPRETVNEQDLVVDKYKPRMFETDALQKSNVRVTWDQVDPERLRMSRKAFDPQADIDQFQDLIAPGPSSDGENSSNEQKCRQLLFEAAGLSDSRKNNDDMQMEVSWEPMKIDAEKIIPIQDDKKDTPWQKYLDTRKEKRREHRVKMREKQKNIRRKREGKSSETDDDSTDDDQDPKLDLLLGNDDENDKKHYNLTTLIEDHKRKNKKIQKKKQNFENEKKIGGDFQINAEDERFSALFRNPMFSIDKSNPKYKSTSGMEQLVEETLRRKIKKNEQNMKETEQEREEMVETSGLLAENLKKKTAKWTEKRAKRRKINVDL